MTNEITLNGKLLRMLHGSRGTVFSKKAPWPSETKNAGQGWGGHPRPAGGERYKKYTYYIHQKYQNVKLKINYSKFLFVKFFNKLFYLRYTALVNQVTVIRFTFGDVSANRGEHNFFYFFGVAGLS
jgi:hypothetical protein